MSPHQQEQEQDQKQQKDRSPVLANGPLDAGVLAARVDGVIAAHGTAAAREPTSRKLFHGGQQQQRRKRRSHAGACPASSTWFARSAGPAVARYCVSEGDPMATLLFVATR